MLWEEIQKVVDRVRSLGGDINVIFPEKLSKAVLIITWGLPLKSIRKTGVMPDILIEASSEFFERVQEEMEAEKKNKAA